MYDKREVVRWRLQDWWVNFDSPWDILFMSCREFSTPSSLPLMVLYYTECDCLHAKASLPLGRRVFSYELWMHDDATTQVTLASSVTDVSTEDTPISHELTEINRQFYILRLVNETTFNRLLTDFFFKNKKFAKIIFKIFFHHLFRKLTEFQPTFFLYI